MNRPFRELPHQDTVRSLAFRPNGQLATACFNEGFSLWDVDTGQVRTHWPVASLNSAVAVSPDGRLLAGGNADGELLLWECDGGAERSSRLTRQGNVYALAFSPDGKTLASANHKGTVSLWDGATGRPLDR